MINFQDIINIYKKYGNHYLVGVLQEEFNQQEDLRGWRRYFEQNGGFSQDSWMPMWESIIGDLNIEKHLDIGVHSSQYSVFPYLLAKKYNKDINVWSISPFNGLGDKYSEYKQKDYLEVFKQSCKDMNINFDDFNIIKGLSQDQDVKDQVKNIKFDLIYIDGDHSYRGVSDDIKYYAFELLSKDGIVICDDALSYIPSGHSPLFKQGHQEVIDAVSDLLDDNKDFELIMEITHNRIFKRR